MSQLPFKTQPKKATKVVGNQEWGELEFPVYGDLIVGERLTIDEAENRLSIFKMTAEAAIEIAKEEKLTYMDAHAFVTKSVLSAAGIDLTLREQELSIKYSSQLNDVGRQIVDASYEKVAVWATAMIRYRLSGMDDWTKERTMGLPQGLVNDIYSFAQSEAEAKSKSNQEKEDESAKLEEELGKLRGVLGSLPSELTGPLLTGSASSTGQQPPSSTATASRSSRRATSRKPSSKAEKPSATPSTSKK